MDLLKAELERKRNVLRDDRSDGDKRMRYLTVAERRRIDEKEEEDTRCEEERRKKKRRRQHHGDGNDKDEKEEEDLTTMITKRYDPKTLRILSTNETTNDVPNSLATTTFDHNAGGIVDNNTGNNDVMRKKDDGIVPELLKRMTLSEVTDALRSFGLPIRLFGEDSSSRLHRLFIAEQGREAAALGESEMDEFANRERTRNVFLPGQDDDDIEENEGRKIKSHGGRGSEGVASTTTVTTVLVLTEEERNDKPKRIYRYFKSLLKQWEDDLTHRPDTIKRSAAGKNETKTVKQCKDYIRPLFQMCKCRQLEEEMQTKLFDIVVNCEAGEFVRAHDSYIDVAIGRAAWPIGVTMVGIHARSGREKIGTSNVAHMMNSEANRKYLTSVKRLMSYAQKKRTDVHPSKKVTNV